MHQNPQKCLVQWLNEIIIHFVIKASNLVLYIGCLGHAFNFKNGYHHNVEGCGTETVDHTNCRQAIQTQLAF